MHNKTELVYRITKTTKPLAYLYITVKDRHGTGDAIYFAWRCEAKNRAQGRITTQNVDFNLNGLLHKMHDAKISGNSSPKEVVLFLEANNIKQAVGIKVVMGRPNHPGCPLTFLITEEEIEAGEVQRNGQTFNICTRLAAQLRQQLKEQQESTLSPS